MICSFFCLFFVLVCAVLVVVAVVVVSVIQLLLSRMALCVCNEPLISLRSIGAVVLSHGWLGVRQ